MIQIECQFAFWNGCELKNIRYAGDEAGTDAELERMNTINPDGKYTQAVKFLMDFLRPRIPVTRPSTPTRIITTMRDGRRAPIRAAGRS